MRLGDLVLIFMSVPIIALALLMLVGCSSYEVSGVDYVNQDDQRNIPRREFTK